MENKLLLFFIKEVAGWPLKGKSCKVNNKFTTKGRDTLLDGYTEDKF